MTGIFLRATVVTRGWNGYRNKSQHRKSTLEKKILPPFQQGFEPATFQSRVRRSNHWAIHAPRHQPIIQCPWSTSFEAKEELKAEPFSRRDGSVCESHEVAVLGSRRPNEPCGFCGPQSNIEPCLGNGHSLSLSYVNRRPRTEALRHHHDCQSA